MAPIRFHHHPTTAALQFIPGSGSQTLLSDSQSLGVNTVEGTTDDYPVPPSSPPVAEYDISLASASPTLSETRGRLPELEEHFLSPEIARLPPPRTPASTRSRYRDNSSEYYTAAWGSPYERSTSPTGSARTALSEQVPSEDQLESSPIPRFGLEHLLPNRLTGLNLPRPRLSRSRSATVESRTEEEEGAHTPRSRTKRWVQLPQRQYSERTHWWSDESQGASDRDGRGQEHTSSSGSADLESSSSQKGHKPREDNRTLNQQDFLDIVRGDRTEEMSGLYASRWATTPPPDEVGEGGEKDSGVLELDPQRTPVATRSGGLKEAGDTPPLEAVEGVKQASSAGVGEVGGTDEANDAGLEMPSKGPVQDKTADVAEPPALEQLGLRSSTQRDLGRLEPPRSKRRVSWRGKTCVISIPTVDFDSSGRPMPLGGEEVQDKLKRWEADGYDTSGFDLAYNTTPKYFDKHARRGRKFCCRTFTGSKRKRNVSLSKGSPLLALSMQHQPVQRAFVTQLPSLHQTPALPELPEEDDEEELQEPASGTSAAEPELPAYVPPHKRAQFNADVAVPTPTRGHQHNISESLERDILEAELRHEAEKRDWIEVIESGEESGPVVGEMQRPRDKPVRGEDSSGVNQPMQEPQHGHKKSLSRFNVAAPAFEFKPTASFQPASTKFAFGTPAEQPPGMSKPGHARQASSGTFNVAAPAFKPSHPLSMPRSDFSFSAQVPAFKPEAPAFEPAKSGIGPRTIVDDLPSIFGKVNIPDIVKPARRSKAVAIVPPEEPPSKLVESSEDYEDEEGRATQGDDRLKRQRFRGHDGNEVPRFADPTPMPDPANFAVNRVSNAGEDMAPGADEDAVTGAEASQDGVVDEIADAAGEETTPSQAETVSKGAHGHKSSSSLSALAAPFHPPATVLPAASDQHAPAKVRSASVSDLEDDLEEGEIAEDEEPDVSPVRNQQPSPGLSPVLSSNQAPLDEPASERIDVVAHPEPSFDEIDAVMRQLNDADLGGPRDVDDDRAMSPLPDFDEQPMPGVTYLPDWSRSHAPSPSPRRQALVDNALADSSFTVHERTDSGERAVNGWPNVTRLNKAEDVPTSDWSDVLSPPDEERLQHRSAFFDNHIDELIGRVVERRLLPLEENLRSIQHNLVKRAQSTDRPSLKRTSSTAESDADDEDELSDEHRHRPMSRGKDKRVDQIKAAVIEALREQSPRRSQSSYDIADLHSALADMKVSFARAASASLDLEDVRAVVEDALHRQGQALIPLATAESKQAHRREMSELEGKWQETLAGALEEANRRRDVEERAAETQRMLRLAEEEVALLREASRDEFDRFAAMDEERRELLDRCEKAEKAHESAEEHGRNIEAENEALQATLEEYRTSSSRWRHDVDDGQREREELESTVADLERQVEETRESGSGMRRRLEKLHADMASAAGQLASEKAVAKAREDDYRIRCEGLEAQQAAQARQRHELEEELRVVHEEVADAKLALGRTKTSDESMEELVRKLRADLAEQTDAGRAEVQRTRMSLETDVELANHRVDVVRSELESQLLKVRAELESARTELETTRTKHERQLEEEGVARQETVRKMSDDARMTLDEARQRHDNDLQVLTMRHDRALQYASEDKERANYIFNERLTLSDAKLQHTHDRILYLEERLEIAKSAAQAAAMNAQGKAPLFVSSLSASPEKVSPQALRESILVLQEQLQDREAHIEQLQNVVADEGAAKLKERDSEITWLRELLAVRSDDLSDLVNTLAQPTFDRDTVRDIAIRIRANLQMEQQEKERFGYPSQSLGGQALASLSSFATPKASSLTSAFNKWRSTMESSSLRTAPLSMSPARSGIPAKSASTSSVPFSYTAGLMTPPASNVRQTPSPEATASLPRPYLQSYSAPAPRQGLADAEAPSTNRRVSDSSEGPTTPLFREQSYDRDAEDSRLHLQSFEDDDLDIADSAPPAFRSIEEELDPAAVDSS
ncbi:hypothetical protein B0A55_02925 [Friedmanniomyces simplex]|uniref:Uncharacterized protein n=1 Tax=Friedmanniomyces simplex TaxID=329884 RepID=A0A4U0XUQ0_9PEZI|nr:hypothetical protein B0A55_02925 [Friedmanniomyces simplex]